VVLNSKDLMIRMVKTIVFSFGSILFLLWQSQNGTTKNQLIQRMAHLQNLLESIANHKPLQL